ncbi:MAG: ATP-dependent sacrificial sulfur transferase LarE [Candidatus Omnitrophica bacterium]|nr:ATP-dependent sacrificial sulfur transferase LarE [Candidatus Omnitrophota bacterium]
MGKIEKLKKILKGMKSVVIAYSGGLDSTFLLKVALDSLGRQNVLAVTARSETYPEAEYKEAMRIVKKIGARHITIHTKELEIKNFKSNPVNRCYYCKKELFRKLDNLRKSRRMRYLLDGTNYDDLKDVRYGRFAAKELGVRSPLLEAKFTKADIRRYSKRLRLPTWDKPPFACLASRLPFHNKITAKNLKRIDEAESYLKSLGFKQVRVRLHKDIARLELLPSDQNKAIKLRDKITNKLRKLGFIYITIDLMGYRTGSMHEAVRYS